MANSFTGLTRTDINTLIAAYAAPAVHTHDDRYYTETEIDSLLLSYATITGTETLTNKTLTTPTIGSFANAGHTHQDAAGGGTLDAAAIASGTLANARVNWAAPDAIGSTTPNTGTFSYATVKQDLGNPAGTDLVKPLMVVQQGVSQIPGLQFGYIVRVAGVSYGGSISTTLNSSSGGWGARLALGVQNYPFAMMIDDATGNIMLAPTSVIASAPEKLNVNGNIGINNGSTFPQSASTNYAVIRGGSGLWAGGNGDLVLMARQSTAKGIALMTGDSTPAVRIGINAYGQIMFGESQFTPSVLMHIRSTGSTTNAVSNVMRREYDSTGMPAAGLGVSVVDAIDTGSNIRDAAIDETYAATITDGSRAFGRIHSVYSVSTKQPYVQAVADSGGVKIGFFGATPIAKPALGAWAGLTDAQKLDALRDALSNLGLASYT